MWWKKEMVMDDYNQGGLKRHHFWGHFSSTITSQDIHNGYDPPYRAVKPFIMLTSEGPTCTSQYFKEEDWGDDSRNDTNTEYLIDFSSK